MRYAAHYPEGRAAATSSHPRHVNTPAARRVAGPADAMTAADLLHRSAAVLSDLDGTLLDSSASVHRTWGRFAQRHGLDPGAVVEFVYGRPVREAIPVLVPGADHDAELAAIEAAELTDTAGVHALPGAGALLGSGRPMAIVTSCSLALATARLRAAGLSAPAVVVSADGLERGKPDPACFLIAADRLGVDPRRCVVLEDAPAGIAAARAAGAPVIALRTTRPDDALEGADYIVDTIADLLGS